MIRVGLTGNIGMGKSFTALCFAELGAAVFNADDAVHAILKHNTRAVKDIAKQFPEAVKNGEVNRKLLGGIVFKDAEKRKKLEAILHPLVRKAEQKTIRDAQKMGARIVVLDIPLLFETGGDGRCDFIVVVRASPSVQKRRVLARPGMTEARFKAILATQLPSIEKERRADAVIDTGRSKERVKAEVRKILEHIRRMQ